MVITSSTQWTIPLSSASSIAAAAAAASSPSLTKYGSLLGLKSCQLSAPPLAIVSELHDLAPTSSRRLLGTHDVSNRRSAGSFRQLVSEEFCAKTRDACTDSLDLLCSKEYDAPYDGIAIPWSSRAFDAGPLGAFDASRANVADLHGEVTAEDVDLLPMPGLLSSPSPFYAESYIAHAHSPKSSKRSTEVSSPESSANSCKSSVMVPNHLGLPPNFNLEVEHTDSVCGGFASICQANVPVTPPADTEHTRGVSSHFLHSTGTHVYSKDADNFSDSLAGLWANPAINCDPDRMLYDSESLASIFNVYPQKFHGLSSSRTIVEFAPETCDDGMAHMGADDLHYLVNPVAATCHAKPAESGSFLVLPASESYNGVENSGSMIWEAMKQGAHVKPCIAMPHSNVGEPSSAQLMDSSAMLSESSLAGSIDTASSLKKKSESIGMKRPYSMLQLAGVASCSASNAGIWHPGSSSMGLPMPLLNEEEATHSFSTMLYKTQKDPKLAGFYNQLAKEQARMDEDMPPQASPAKVRRKHGTAMDPQSVAARSRREKFSDRIRILQSLVPNGERLDTVSMLGQTLEYVKYLQHQVWQLYHGKEPLLPDNSCEKWKDFVEAERASINLA